mgnify:FL=1
MINGELLATTNDIPAKIIMKNCHLFQAQILSDITGISEDKFISNEFIDTNIPISLKHYCASDLAFKISEEQIVTARVYTCYTRNNNVKDFLYQANYQNNICARLRSQGKSIGNANVTQIVFYHKCPNIGDFFIQKQGFHNKELHNHSSEMITRYTINLDNIDNILYTESVSKRLIANLKFLLSDAKTKLELAKNNKFWKEVIKVLVQFDENGMPIHDLDAALDITRISLIEDGKEIGRVEGEKIGEKTARKNIITKLISNGMSIEELSQKLNMSVTDINSLSNQNVTS